MFIFACFMAVTREVGSVKLIKQAEKFNFAKFIADRDHFDTRLFQELNMRSWNVLICRIFNDSFIFVVFVQPSTSRFS